MCRVMSFVTFRLFFLLKLHIHQSSHSLKFLLKKLEHVLSFVHYVRVLKMVNGMCNFDEIISKYQKEYHLQGSFKSKCIITFFSKEIYYVNRSNVNNLDFKTSHYKCPSYKLPYFHPWP